MSYLSVVKNSFSFPSNWTLCRGQITDEDGAWWPSGGEDMLAAVRPSLAVTDLSDLWLTEHLRHERALLLRNGLGQARGQGRRRDLWLSLDSCLCWSLGGKNR